MSLKNKDLKLLPQFSGVIELILNSSSSVDTCQVTAVSGYQQYYTS